MKLINTLLVTLLLLFGHQYKSFGQQKYHRMNVVEFKQAITQDSIQLIDVRTPSEYAKGFIKNAVLIDIWDKSTFLEKIEQLDKSKPTYIYCKAGVRSLHALKILKKRGFYKVYDLKGGYDAWLKEE